MKFEEIIDEAISAMLEQDQVQFSALLDSMDDKQKIFFEGFVEGYTMALRQVSMAENDS